MTKAALVSEVAKKAGVKKSDAEKVIVALFGARDGKGVIAAALKKGEKVTLPGFGTFKVSRRAARTGTNPSTLKPMKIAAKNVARFTVGAALKKSL